jgi:hypothetical protein
VCQLGLFCSEQFSNFGSSNLKPIKTMKPIFHKGIAYARQTRTTATKSLSSFVGNLSPLTLALLLVCIMAATFAPVIGAAKIAMLYMYADNGKKSGRADGNVYMRNGRIRAMRVPSLVRNGYTTGVRSLFASFSSSFRSLGTGVIKAWNAFSYSNSDVFGRAKTVSGKQAFVGLNQNLSNIGAPTIDAPPTLAGASAQTAAGMTISIGDATIAFDEYGAANAEMHYLVFATAPQSTGVSRPSASAFRIITSQTNLSTGGNDALLYAAYVTKFGEPPLGSQVFITWKGINKTTGEAIAGEVFSAQVTA